MGILDWGKSNLKTIQKLTTQVTSLQQTLLTTEAKLQKTNDRVRLLETNNATLHASVESQNSAFTNLLQLHDHMCRNLNR